MKVPFYKHQLGKEEVSSFEKAISSDILTTGSEVSLFEDEFSDFLNIKHSVALQSCTAALHLALEAFEFPRGSEVITTPLTFVATSLAILQAGLKPVFCDIDPLTGNIDLNQIKFFINSKTVAVLPVHLYGQMVDMHELSNICKLYNLKCIEDAAHCVEGKRNSIQPGELSDGACFSFYATKNITCGEGGCFSTNSTSLATKVRLLRSHGVNKIAFDRYREGYTHWDLQMNGWKYNLDNLHASILRPQIPLINKKLIKREYAARYYEISLSKIPEVKVLHRHKNVIHARHLFPIKVDPEKRDDLILYLQGNNIGVVVNYRCLSNYQTLLDESIYNSSSFVNSLSFGDSVLSLPLYPQIQKDQLIYTVECIKSFFK